MKNPTKIALAHRLCPTESQDPQKQGMLTTTAHVWNYVIVPYRTVDMIAVAEADNTIFKRPEYRSAVRSLAFYRKKLCVVVMDMEKHVLEDFLLKNPCVIQTLNANLLKDICRRDVAKPSAKWGVLYRAPRKRQERRLPYL